MTNLNSHPKYGQMVYSRGKCPLCSGSMRKSWPDEEFLKKCLSCGIEYSKNKDKEHIAVSKAESDLAEHEQNEDAYLLSMGLD